MATAQQIKMLIKAHIDGDSDKFNTVVLQLAAHEAKQGHKVIAREIRDLLDKSKENTLNRIVPFRKELNELSYVYKQDENLPMLVASEELIWRIKRIIKEYRQKSKLQKYGLSNRRKILLAGPPGTGKTLTASILANELDLPLCTILMDKMITKYMGETSAKLRLIFDNISNNKAVYLFDEFDAIGAERNKDNDVGEMRRVLNSFLQFIERDSSSSLIIAATNNIGLLDRALFRRFDDILHYELPNKNQIERLMLNRLNVFFKEELIPEEILDDAKSLSHAEISLACDDAIKESILKDKTNVGLTLLRTVVQHRKDAYKMRYSNDK